MLLGAKDENSNYKQYKDNKLCLHFPSLLNLWEIAGCSRLPALQFQNQYITRVSEPGSQYLLKPWLRIYSLVNLSSFSLLLQLKSSSKLSILTFYWVVQLIPGGHLRFWWEREEPVQLKDNFILSLVPNYCFETNLAKKIRSVQTFLF